MRTSMPRVHEVLPDDEYKHFKYRPDLAHCPQLAVIDILGDLYFGAVSHVEERIFRHLDRHPEQRFLLIRMHNVNNCDFSGIHMLESVVHACRERGGDVYMVRVGFRVNRVMKSTGFGDQLGQENFLIEEDAISFLFHKVLDPAVCIYECHQRVFKECQNLPKRLYLEELGFSDEDYIAHEVQEISANDLWVEVREKQSNLTVVDVREPREFRQGHIPDASLVPLPTILMGDYQFEVGRKHKVVLVCRSGRRSRRAALRIGNGTGQVRILKGGMLAWEAAGLLEAID
jgi:SulP family sulfate permease